MISERTSETVTDRDIVAIDIEPGRPAAELPRRQSGQASRQLVPLTTRPFQRRARTGVSRRLATRRRTAGRRLADGGRTTPAVRRHRGARTRHPVLRVEYHRRVHATQRRRSARARLPGHQLLGVGGRQRRLAGGHPSDEQDRVRGTTVSGPRGVRGEADQRAPSSAVVGRRLHAGAGPAGRLQGPQLPLHTQPYRRQPAASRVGGRQRTAKRRQNGGRQPAAIRAVPSRHSTNLRECRAARGRGGGGRWT